MSSEKTCKKKLRVRINREHITAKNKARRIAKEARRQALDASKRPRRKQLRYFGAIRRLRARIGLLDVTNDAQREQVQRLTDSAISAVMALYEHEHTFSLPRSNA
ncbi:MAG: hypothetical protein KDA57_13950 [Planctomycetales bacterium]|nr:hypothetical protein [Planctomycetales bacterium]